MSKKIAGLYERKRDQDWGLRKCVAETGRPFLLKLLAKIKLLVAASATTIVISNQDYIGQ